MDFVAGYGWFRYEALTLYSTYDKDGGDSFSMVLVISQQLFSQYVYLSV